MFLFVVMYILTRDLLALLFFFNAPAPTEIYTLSLHDALPILFLSSFKTVRLLKSNFKLGTKSTNFRKLLVLVQFRSEEHTSELQSHSDIVCRLLLEKKNASSRGNT